MHKDRWIHFFLLIIFIFLINTWSLHHFGSNLWNLSFINGILVLIAIGKFLLKLWDKSRQKEFSRIIGRILNFFLETSVLAVFFIMFIIVSLLVSSVTVISSGLDEQANVYLTSEGQKRASESSKMLEGPNDIERFIRFVNPFGRAFYLEVDGFIRYSFDLYPWVGKKVRVTQDLQVAPSVLIRIPHEVFGVLSEEKLEILSDGHVIVEKKCAYGQGSILVGRDMPLPFSFVERWKIEILAMGINDQSQVARILLAWQNPLKAEPEESLMPGMKLEARLKVNNVIVARAEFRIGEEKIQDIKMNMEEL